MAGLPISWKIVTNSSPREIKGRHKVCVLAYDQLCTFEFAAAVELLRDRSADFGDHWYELTICALERSPVCGGGGILVDARGDAEALSLADTVIIPGWRMGSVPSFITHPLTAAHARGARIASICTGAFVLAAAGLLNGRRATTHWKYASQLAAEYPAIEVDPSVLYIDDGDVVTSAGSAAGIDMLLHLIRQDYGARTCNAVARMMVVPPHREGGQAQFFERPVPRSVGTAFAQVLDHLRRNPSDDHRIQQLAEMAAMSPRTFFRRFRAATGQTPYDWLLQERINVAKELLESTALSIDRVAYDAGFGAADTLRHHFRRLVGTTPNDFRYAFRNARIGAKIS